MEECTKSPKHQIQIMGWISAKPAEYAFLPFLFILRRGHTSQTSNTSQGSANGSGEFGICWANWEFQKCPMRNVCLSTKHEWWDCSSGNKGKMFFLILIFFVSMLFCVYIYNIYIWSCCCCDKWCDSWLNLLGIDAKNAHDILWNLCITLGGGSCP